MTLVKFLIFYWTLSLSWSQNMTIEKDFGIDFKISLSVPLFQQCFVIVFFLKTQVVNIKEKELMCINLLLKKHSSLPSLNET